MSLFQFALVTIVSHSHNGHSDTKYHHEQIPRVVLGNVFSWSYSHMGKTNSLMLRLNMFLAGNQLYER